MLSSSLVSCILLCSIFLFNNIYACNNVNTSSTSTILSIFSNINNLNVLPWWNSTCNICSWNTTRIMCVPYSDIIISIDLSSLQLTGSLNNIYWPSSIKYINLNNNNLNGVLSWSLFPSSIKYLLLANNQFNGIIDFEDINYYLNNLTLLYLSNNQFTGELLWEYLYNNITDGSSLKYLFLTNNSLSGNINFGEMPESLIYCFLGFNEFDGYLDFGYNSYNDNNTEDLNITNLFPSTLINIQYLDVSHNNFHGNIMNIDNIPNSIKYLNVNNNNFRNNINQILNKLSITNIQDLSLSNNAFSGNIDWQNIFNETQFNQLINFYIYSNNINGSVQLAYLPETMERFYFYNNKFSGYLDLEQISSSLLYLIGDNNRLSGGLNLEFLYSRNIEYLWLYNNLFNHTVLDITSYNNTLSLKQLILSNNKLSGYVDLSMIDINMPYITELYLENNLFINSDDIDFNDVDIDTTIKLDEYLSCNSLEYCNDDSFNCSIPRTNNQCKGSMNCILTCKCVFSSNCSDYSDELPIDYYINNYTTPLYHNILTDIHTFDDNIDDTYYLNMINITIDIDLNVSAPITSTYATPSPSYSNTGGDNGGGEENALADIFGSEIAAYIVFIVGFILIILAIYFIIRFYKQREAKKRMDIVHNIKNEEDDRRRQYWEEKKKSAINIGSSSDDDVDATKSEKKQLAGGAVAANFLTLEPMGDIKKIKDIQKKQIHHFEKAASLSSVSPDDNTGVDVLDDANTQQQLINSNQNAPQQDIEQATAMVQQQAMMNMMYMNNMMNTYSMMQNTLHPTGNSTGNSTDLSMNPAMNPVMNPVMNPAMNPVMNPAMNPVMNVGMDNASMNAMNMNAASVAINQPMNSSMMTGMNMLNPMNGMNAMNGMDPMNQINMMNMMGGSMMGGSMMNVGIMQQPMVNQMVGMNVASNPNTIQSMASMQQMTINDPNDITTMGTTMGTMGTTNGTTMDTVGVTQDDTTGGNNDGQPRHHTTTSFPNLPKEKMNSVAPGMPSINDNQDDDDDTTDGNETDDELFDNPHNDNADNYQSPGGPVGPNGAVEMQQFSMAPFD